MKLTGKQRFQLMPIWFKQKDFQGNFEEYVKRVCKQKGIEYVPPKPNEDKRP